MMKRTVCLCLVMLLLLPMVLTGCGTELEKTTKGFNEKFGDKRVAIHTVDNERFQLIYQDYGLQHVIMLYDKQAGKVYSSVPYDYYLGQNPLSADNAYADSILSNPLSISYIKTNEETNMSNIDYADASTDCIEKQQSIQKPLLDENGKQQVDADGNPLYETEWLFIDSPAGDGTQWEKNGITSEIIDNGVRVTYSFPELRIAVAVEYVLESNGLVVRIPMDRIEEDDNLLFEVSVLPYFASAAHEQETKGDSYLMLPSGGGALVYGQKLNKKATYSEAVYGTDASEPVSMIKRIDRQVHMPVFGAKMGKTTVAENTDASVLGILENGASCGRINATIGDADVGYSCAYASFRVRGQDEVLYNSMGNQELAAPSFSKSIVDYKELSVRYIPVDGDASYMGMANTYRSYLQSKGYLKSRPTSTPALSVSLLGGTQTRESFFGIPYDTTTTTTTVEQSLTISKELKKLVGNDQLLVTLMGYGEGGLANTVVGGGYELEGDDDAWAALRDYAKKNNIVLSLDYETIKFNESGSGFSVGDDAAYTISQLEAKMRTYVLNTAVENEAKYWYLLTRSQQAEAVRKAIENAKENGFNSVSFATLSSVAYSDYHDGHYTAKAHMAEDVAALLKEVKKNGLGIVSTKANEYAALNADYIIETPLQSSKLSLFDEEIPFYSIVFQGYKALTSTSINTSVNVKNAYLNAVATGAALQFTLCDTPHDSLRFEEDTAYITSRYANWKKDIAAMVKEYDAVHDRVGNKAIVEYTKKDGVSKTVFEDGTTIYVNYNKTATGCPAGEIPAQGFIVG
ncbi:MAG: hypothetical protein E7527_02405 [Ruminococcaceae bacterium]|nr:hypothetical protein [Oscillospiraceae bacterium]